MDEGGDIVAPAALANAVQDALAQQRAVVEETPLKPEYVRRLVIEAGYGFK
ncbi:MAG: hypothetical protein QW470_04515 [Candidatus Caldarchaeum sp.]